MSKSILQETKSERIVLDVSPVAAKRTKLSDEVLKLIGVDIKMEEGMALVKQYNLIIYKYTFSNFMLDKSLWNLAVKVHKN